MKRGLKCWTFLQLLAITVWFAKRLLLLLVQTRVGEHAAVPPRTLPAVSAAFGRPGGSLGHAHGGVGVGVEQFFVERRKENVDRLRVQLLEGLQLLRVQRAQRRQGGNSANQLPGIKRSLGWRTRPETGLAAGGWGVAYLGQSVFVHVVLLHDVLQRKVDLLLELLDFPGLHQPGPIWAGDRRRALVCWPGDFLFPVGKLRPVEMSTAAEKSAISSSVSCREHKLLAKSKTALTSSSHPGRERSHKDGDQ